MDNNKAYDKDEETSMKGFLIGIIGIIIVLIILLCNQKPNKNEFKRNSNKHQCYSCWDNTYILRNRIYKVVFKSNYRA